jgi:hypothetical protein
MIARRLFPHALVRRDDGVDSGGLASRQTAAFGPKPAKAHRLWPPFTALYSPLSTILNTAGINNTGLSMDL